MKLNLYNFYTEGKLVKEERDKLKSSEFGLPKQRRFPIHDEEHTKKAIQLFSKCEEKYRNELANNIFKKTNKFNIKINKDSKIFNYLSKENQNKILNKKNLNESLGNDYIMDFIDFLQIKLNDKNIAEYSLSLPKLLTLSVDEETEDGIILVDRYDQVAGYIYYNKVEKKLIEIYINPIYRNQGYASSLLQNKANEIFNVRVAKDNEVAKQFFDHNNFKIIGESECFYFMSNQNNSELNEDTINGNFSGIDTTNLDIDTSLNDFERLAELSVAGVADVVGKPINKKPYNKYNQQTDLDDDTLFIDEANGIIKYEDLSTELYHGINRLIPDKKGVNMLNISPIEAVDELKLTRVLPYINRNTFVTSDLHLKYKTRNSENLFNLLINNFNQRMGIDDTLMILGDIGCKDKIDSTYIQHLTDFINKLNVGRKILILGNHDTLKLSQYYEMGFDFVGMRIENSDFIFTHMPVETSGRKINIHGHIHASREYWNMDWHRHIDVYIKDHDYQALTINEYLNLYKQGKYKGKTVKKDFTKDGN